MPVTPPSRTRSRLGVAVAVVAACLATAGPAVAAGEVTGLAASQVSPTQSRSLTFTWAPPSAPLPGTLTGYVGALSPAGAPPAPLADAVTSPQTYDGLADGAYTFRVAAVYDDGITGPQQGDPAAATVVVDDTDPVLSLSLIGSGANGWYRTLFIHRVACGDATSGLVDPSVCQDEQWTLDGEYGSGTSVTAQDVAGNSTTAATPPFDFDGTAPLAGQPSAPGRLVADEPVFEWTRGEDPTSGVDRYQVQYRLAGAANPWITIASVDHVAGNPALDFYSSRRQPSVSDEPLPEKKLLQWRVRTIDVAGNVADSNPVELEIDSTVPPAPTITGGPTAPTRVSSPTFSWKGEHPTFLWDLTLTGSTNPIRRGGGPQTQATIANLPDGDYTFRVSQVTEYGRPSAEATRSFKVDTTPPAAPLIVVRPPFPAVSAPVFSWQTEAGAFSRWTLLGEGGVTIVPSTDTPTTTAALPPLADGAYSFQVRQVDAAGNVSAAAVEPFSMLAPLTPAPAPSTGTASAAATKLPRQNATRLRPRPGRTLPTRSPVLQWKRGPRGTKLYNLQIFRVVKRKGSTPKISKILSRFPRGTQFRAPKKTLRPNTCYVWRVWPYTGRSFTPRPVGVSNFCVANSKVLKRKAAQARARKIAAARRAALARARKAAPRR